MTRDRTIEKGTFSPNSKQGGLYPVPPPPPPTSFLIKDFKATLLKRDSNDQSKAIWLLHNLFV